MTSSCVSLHGLIGKLYDEEGSMSRLKAKL